MTVGNSPSPFALSLLTFPKIGKIEFDSCLLFTYPASPTPHFSPSIAVFSVSKLENIHLRTPCFTFIIVSSHGITVLSARPTYLASLKFIREYLMNFVATCGARLRLALLRLPFGSTRLCFRDLIPHQRHKQLCHKPNQNCAANTIFRPYSQWFNLDLILQRMKDLLKRILFSVTFKRFCKCQILA